MTNREQISSEQDRSKSINRKQRLRKLVGLTVFLSVAIFLSATVAYFASIRQSARREVALLEQTRDELKAIADRIATAANQAESNKRVVLNSLRHCRSAEDIPDLPGGRIVAARKGIESLCLVVPEGVHTLEVASTWGPVSSAFTFSGEKIGEGEGGGNKTWNVPLWPACGYWLTVVGDRRGGPVRWELTSNHPEFESQSEIVPIDAFSQRGSSHSTMDVVQFPNQIGYSPRMAQVASQTPPGVQLMHKTLNGTRHDQQFAVRFTIRLLSEGPPCISAHDAQLAIVSGRDDDLLPYRGGGKYELRMPETD